MIMFSTDSWSRSDYGTLTYWTADIIDIEKL